MNFIVLIFIIISTIFLASSVNNLLTTNSALSYFAEVTNVADFFLLTVSTDEVEAWADSKDYIGSLEKEKYIILETDEVRLGQKKYELTMTTALGKLPRDNNRITDAEDRVIQEMKPGEIGMSYVEAQQNDVEIGDEITIILKGKEKTFKVTYIFKDMLFGSAYMGVTRLIISDSDYEYLCTADTTIWDLYSFTTEEVTQLSSDINQENFMITYMFDRSALDSTYLLDLMIFSILIIVGICLICIAFVVLRFAIVFTLQEDYREIGIMKAIGLKDGNIKKIYLIKYLFIAIFGAVIGLILSIPFGELFMQTVRHQIVIKSAVNSLIISVLCAAGVVLLVIIFCYFSTGKVNKYTVIQAIRNGSTGERFRKKGLLKLNTRKQLPVVLYLAFNDILSNIRTYLVLILVFTLGALLVILPANASNTLQSDSVIDLFGIISTDVYIDNNRYSTYAGQEEQMISDLEELEALYLENGVELKLMAEKAFVAYAYLEDEENKIALSCIQGYRSTADEYIYLDGTAPRLENEIAVTRNTMERLGAEVGDYVYIRIGEETNQYIITASYQTMMNMGEQIRLSEAVPDDSSALSGLYTLQGQFQNREDIEGQIEVLKESTPDYKVRTVREYTDTMLKATRDTLLTMKYTILIIVMIINALISVLMCKSLFAKDVGTIALMKSMGFKDTAIRIWQAARIITVMLVSLAAGILISRPLDYVVGALTFGIMGASTIEMVVIVPEVYILYPAVLLAATILAAGISTLKVKKVGLKELGNIE